MASQNQAVAPQAMAAPQPRAGKKAEGTRARKFKCERCPHLEGWSNAGDKRQHDLSVHGEGEKAACPTCQRGYTDMSGLRKHRLVCKEKGPDEAVYYMCPWCHGTKEGSTNLRNDNLKRHANRCDGREGPQDKDARDALWKRQERMSKNDIAAKKLAYTEKHGDDMPPGVSRRHRAVRQSRVERTEEPASHADPQRQHVFEDDVLPNDLAWPKFASSSEVDQTDDPAEGVLQDSHFFDEAVSYLDIDGTADFGLDAFPRLDNHPSYMGPTAGFSNISQRYDGLDRLDEPFAQVPGALPGPPGADYSYHTATIPAWPALTVAPQDTMYSPYAQLGTSGLPSTEMELAIDPRLPEVTPSAHIEEQTYDFTGPAIDWDLLDREAYRTAQSASSADESLEYQHINTPSLFGTNDI